MIRTGLLISSIILCSYLSKPLFFAQKSSGLLNQEFNLNKSLSYAQVLDSVAFYLKPASFFTPGQQGVVQLISYFKPGYYDAIKEADDNKLFQTNCGNQKSKVILFNGNQFYVLDLASMNKAFISPWRRHSIKITDPGGKVKFKHSTIAREFNGRGGSMENEIILYFPVEENREQVAEKLTYFLQLATSKAKDL